MEKWPILKQNHGLTPSEKNSIFRLFQLLVFIAQKGMEKWPILDQNDGLTPLKKTQFLDFLQFLFL